MVWGPWLNQISQHTRTHPPSSSSLVIRRTLGIVQIAFATTQTGRRHCPEPVYIAISFFLFLSSSP